MTAAPYRVIDSKHWASRARTSARASFGEKSLHMRVPAARRGMRPTRSRKARRRTCTCWRRASTQMMAARRCDFRHAVGGSVFSVGSICWPSCLPVDENVSKITATCCRFLAMPLAGSVRCGGKFSLPKEQTASWKPAATRRHERSAKIERDHAADEALPHRHVQLSSKLDSRRGESSRRPHRNEAISDIHASKS